MCVGVMTRRPTGKLCKKLENLTFGQAKCVLPSVFFSIIVFYFIFRSLAMKVVDEATVPTTNEQQELVEKKIKSNNQNNKIKQHKVAAARRSS